MLYRIARFIIITRSAVNTAMKPYTLDNSILLTGSDPGFPWIEN